MTPTGKTTPMLRLWAAVCVLGLALVLLLHTPTARAAGEFGIEKFELAISADEAGTPATQAGSHPYSLSTTLVFNNHEADEFGEPHTFPDGSDPKDLEVNLPPGLIANPLATQTRCTEAQITSAAECPTASAVGLITLHTNAFTNAPSPVYNMVPPPGVPAELAFNFAGTGAIVHIDANVRTGKDYGVVANVTSITQKVALYGATLTLWGDPSAESHDKERGYCGTFGGKGKVREEEEEIETSGKNPNRTYFCAVQRTDRPFLTMPTACTGEPLVATVRADPWSEPGNFTPLATSTAAGPTTGCSSLDFTPSLAANPTSTVAESPSGLNVSLKLPQEESLAGLAESAMRSAVVQLPAGMAVSPSAANGLGACSLEQIGLDNDQTPSCPASSRIGSVKIDTPLLEAPLEGSVYVAQQGNLLGNGSNPFGSLLALYVVAEGSGALVKLPGEISLNSSTGQLTASFAEDPITSRALGSSQLLPQLPFSEFDMSFEAGPRAPLVLPSACGTYTVSSQLTPWSGAGAASPSSSFSVGGCGSGFAPALVAGTTSNQAGAFSPFTVSLTRQDREQRLSRIQVTAPVGVLGVLKSVVQCPEPQASKAECGPESQIGEATVAAGPGEDPYSVGGGRVYLTGPYAGAPFGLSVVVPAVAGPFNLGQENVRAQVLVDPHTAQITVRTDNLPTILQGVPLDVRTIHVTVNRPGFMFNSTGCEPQAVTGVIESTSATSSAVSSPFEAANCANLPFKPTFTALTNAKTSKAGGAYLHVKIVSGAGQANIGKVKVDLPLQLPSRLTTLQKACLAATFEVDPAACPPLSVVGSASAVTPLLAHPLSGPAYLVSHGGAAFPDLEMVLQGEGITLVLDGQTYIKKGITSSTFRSVPDAPISSFDLVLSQGSDSLLAANLPKTAKNSMCGQTLAMPTEITGQNGVVVKQTTKIAVSGCSTAKAKTKVKKKPAKKPKVSKKKK